MDFKQIQDLVKLINKSNIGELTIEEKEFKITIKQKKENLISVASPMVQTVPMIQAAPSGVSEERKAGTSEGAPADDSKADDSGNYVTVKSPMIGTFYRKPAPDKPLFVEVGDEIQTGQVVCIIEAMKLFNEIESEVSGKVVKILVEDASPVEYDQPLFLVQPF